ncbi:hypothetical protein E4U40_000908 [Claviceps sp. LM458 group G5]|nr:hypothetical protein E4U40_000908 [Claviceps sp. LM458 group G5]
MQGEEELTESVGIVDVGLSVVVCRDSEDSLLTTVLNVVKVVEGSVVTVDKESELEAGCEMKSDTEAELDVASAVDVEAAVEASDVLASVGNFSTKLVGYAVLEERETELAEAAVDAADVLRCVFGKLELIAAAVLEAGFAVDSEGTAEDAAEEAAEFAPEAAEIVAFVLSASFELEDSMELIGAVSVEADSVVDAEAAVEASGVLTRVWNFSFKLVGYTVLDERETGVAEDASDSTGMLSYVLGKLERTTEAVLEAGFSDDGEEAAEEAAEITAEVATEMAAEVDPDDAAKFAVEAGGGILACVLSAPFELEDSMKLIGAVAVETDSVVDARAAVEASGVLTRVGNLCFKLVGYAVPEERELKLAEAAEEAAGILSGGFGKFELIAAAVLEEGFSDDDEKAAEKAAEINAEVATEMAAEVGPDDAAGFAVEAAGGKLACVLSTSFELEDSMKLIGAVSVETDSVVDAEAGVEASGVLTRVGNLSFKLVGYAVPEEEETEPAEDAVDVAGMLDCEFGKLGLIAEAVLAAGFMVETEDAAEDAAEVAVESAGGKLACVLSASLKLAYPLGPMSVIAVEKDSVVDDEAAVEASIVLARVGNLSFKLVGYAVPEERETELAEDAVDVAGMLDWFTVDGEDAAEEAAEEAAEVAPEAAEILACVLSAWFELEDPMKLIGAVSVEADSVVDAGPAVEASGVLARVGNLSLKLVRYAVPEERETGLTEAAVDAADMLDCVLGKSERTTEAVLGAGFSDDGEEAAEEAAEISAEVSTDMAAEVDPGDAAEVALESAAGILACVLSNLLKLVYSAELMSAIAVVVDAEATVEAFDLLTRVRNLSFKLVWYAVAEE